jgi:hypothetical protein
MKPEYEKRSGFCSTLALTWHNVEQALSPALAKNSRGRLFTILPFQERGFYPYIAPL